ncbi:MULTISPECIES: cell wall-binding repeat-containing protein [unclassified Sutcliffiella]|uniref:cell wall-binding repeat-containing protein n=1 Tax=unclassified Sutcliffiella TaxID=2837532 RepID=UPI0030CF9C19
MRKFIMLICLVLFTTLLEVNTAEASGPTRIDGANRYDVAVNVSREGWTTSNTVIISSGDAYADALAASPLAYRLNAPILLTRAGSLPDTTKKRLQELRASNVIVIGGTTSVSDNVISEIRRLGSSINVRRISGKDRFEVAANIANELPAKNIAIVANGRAEADSLSIAPYAARNGIPILLTESNSIPSITSTTLRNRNVSTTYVMGGETSVSRTVFNNLPSTTKTRIGGNDRFQVATNVVKQLNLNAKKAYIANGHAYADALAGSVLAAKQNSVILLTQPTQVPSTTINVIKEKGIGTFVVLGGTTSVGTNVVRTLSAPMLGKRVAIDAGHGGTDPGAVGNGVQEKTVVLDIAKRLESKVTTAGSLPLMTRTNDVYIPLADRVLDAQNRGADIFVSIHANSFTDPSSNGTETWYNGRYQSKESKELAEAIQGELVKELGLRDRGVKEGSFVVIRDSQMPSVLVEIAFISNPDEAKLLANASFREKAAQAIYNGVEKYFSN